MKLFLKTCGRCEFADLERVPRTWWMRLLTPMRHYHCGKCNTTLLAPKAKVEARQWMTTTARNFVPPQPEDQKGNQA